MSEVPDSARLEQGLRRLEGELSRVHGHGIRLGRSLYAAMNRDLQEAMSRAERAERRAARAEKRAVRSEKRAVRSEAELAQIRASTTWKAGRALVALPAAVRRALEQRKG